MICNANETASETIKALEDAIKKGDAPIGECFSCVISKSTAKETLALINRQQAEIERLTERNFELAEKGEAVCIAYKTAKAEAIKEFAKKVDEILKRYAHLHKHAEKARHSTEEYADGTPMEMVSVWEVLSLKKWEMCDYETMSTLQDNIETIEKARLLSELEKDFMLLKKEMAGDSN